MEERLILRRQRRVLLLQGPYAFRVFQTDSLRISGGRHFHESSVAPIRGTVKFWFRRPTGNARPRQRFSPRPPRPQSASSPDRMFPDRMFPGYFYEASFPHSSRQRAAHKQFAVSDFLN